MGLLNADLPEGILDAAEMYAGCVSGALEKTEYLTIIKNADFQNLEIRKEHEINLPDSLLLRFISNNELAEYRKKKSAIISITINAKKS
ncbi:MAG: hypothetical protein ACYCZ2_12430 [Lutibacter sp.]